MPSVCVCVCMFFFPPHLSPRLEPLARLSQPASPHVSTVRHGPPVLPRNIDAASGSWLSTRARSPVPSLLALSRHISA
ncbi:hypothetical protein AcW2_005284 [Taiwanofungus camphoratus]|nr:hypothetical protein AcW2_005284 [Antrodia cinnamomea]